MRLLLADRLATPAPRASTIRESIAAHADDMPLAAAGRSAGTAERVDRLADAMTGVNLRIGQIRRIPRAGQTIKRETYDRIEAGNGEDRLEVSVASCFGWVTVARSIRPIAVARARPPRPCS